MKFLLLILLSFFIIIYYYYIIGIINFINLEIEIRINKKQWAW